MFPAGLIRHFRESAQQLLKDLSHGVVVHLIRVEIDLGELVAEDEQSIVPVQSVDKLIEVEVFDDVPDILAEAVEVVVEIEPDVVGVGFQAGEVVSGGVVETGIRLFQDNLRQGLFGDDIFEAVVGFNGFVFSVVFRQDAVQSAQHEEGEGDVAVFVGFEEASEDIVGYVPNEVCEFLVVCHGFYEGIGGLTTSEKSL